MQCLRYSFLIFSASIQYAFQASAAPPSRRSSQKPLKIISTEKLRGDNSETGFLSIPMLTYREILPHDNLLCNSLKYTFSIKKFTSDKRLSVSQNLFLHNFNFDFLNSKL